MGDRVLFATNDYPNATAEMQFAGFPFYMPAGSDPTGDYTLYPFQETLKEYCRWLRIKTLRIHGNWHCEYDDGGPGGFKSEDVSFDFTMDRGISSEKEIYRPYPGSQVQGLNINFTGGTNVLNSNGFSVEILCGIGIDVGAFGKIIGGKRCAAFNFAVFGQYGSESNGFYGGIDYGNFKYNFLGNEVPSLANVSGGSPSTSGIMTVEAVEWWPYAAKDGSPIYDTVTGAQLQDPRN